ncbi:MAG: CAP domain-containing protein [Pyrinomonadaceae bacterium]
MKNNIVRFLIAPIIILFVVFAANAQKNMKPIPKPISTSAPKTIEKPVEKPIEKPVVKTEQKVSMSALEQSVAEEINAARTDPKIYLPYLEEYRKSLKGNVLYLPNSSGIAMIEGASAIDEAIEELKKMPKTDAFAVTNGMNKVAKIHLDDLMDDDTLGHKSKDGSDLTARFSRVGFSDGRIAENISYKVDKAREVVLTMIIDDGLKSRSHRKNIFSPTFKLLGIACGKGKSNTALCVAEFADAFAEKK